MKKSPGSIPSTDLRPREGSPSPRLSKADFKERFLNQFRDKAYDALSTELSKIADAAWDAYAHQRKSPNTRKAGDGYYDPDYDLSTDWLAASAAIDLAQKRYEDRSRAPRILVINGSGRSEHSCPGEVSKSYRMSEMAATIFREAGMQVEILDLSRVASEYGRHIHPCKACFSTAAALCHWPCSCYPNYSLGQTHDWMNEIYPMWVEASGVMIITPVNWYQATTPLKSMIDRLVCADGGNPDPTSTHGKTAEEAKEIELAGWDYPRHLKGRLFSVVVHGDTEGVGNLRRSLSDWLKSMDLSPAGPLAEVDRYIGYWEPYATSHEAFDRDKPFQVEVLNAAATLRDAVLAARHGIRAEAGADLELPRQK